MISYWKRFAAWATESKDSLFFLARVKLTIVAIIGIVAGLIGYNFVFDYLRDRGVREGAANAIINSDTFDSDKTAVAELAANNIINNLERSETKIQLTIMAIVIAASYVVSGRVLKPIKKVVEAQKRFISDAAHELRTPLSIMKANSEVALLDTPHDSQKEMVMAIKSNIEEVDRMSQMIKNLINIRHVSEETQQIPFSKIDMAPLVSKMAENARQQWSDKKGVSLLIPKTETSVIWGNPTAIEEMIINLLKNAIFYSKPGGLVMISLRNKGSREIELAVEDNGIGISKKDLPHIFEPFYRADESRSSIGDGFNNNMDQSGLGLTIVREIIKQHHGSISIQSKIGHGTTVKVNFTKSKEFSSA